MGHARQRMRGCPGHSAVVKMGREVMLGCSCLVGLLRVANTSSSAGLREVRTTTEPVGWPAAAVTARLMVTR